MLPAMGYSEQQLRELEATFDAVGCYVVVAGIPVDLARLVLCRHSIRQATYELVELGEPTLTQVWEPTIAQAR